MRSIALVFMLFLIAVSGSAQARDTDAKIKDAMIKQSISSYPGNCPCPYNRARNGARCGSRSAYNRPGGYEPLCYPDDITPEMVDAYRREQAKVPARAGAKG